MKNKFKIFLKKWSVVVVFVAMQLLTYASAQNTNTNVYVWDFKTSSENIEKFAEKLTDDFETELIKLDKYTVLQRRNHNLIVVHKNMENAISSVESLPEDAVGKLKTIRAEIVIFGELMEDIDSGIYEVSVYFQNLNDGKIPKKEHIIIEKALIKSNSHRKEYMKSLIKKLHAKEILEAKNEQLSFISKKMNAYLVRAKDVQTAFDDIISLSLQNEAYFKELENTINAYNKIFIDLNDNREKYLLGFQSVYGKIYGADLESIYTGILNDIHKKHVLKLNNVRKKIIAYRASQKIKKEREKLKKEIIRDSENSTLGLNVAIDKVEDEMDRLVLNIKEEIKE